MHQPVEPPEKAFEKEIEEALNEFNTYCYDLLCSVEFDLDGFHEGVRHVIKKYTEVIAPVLNKHNRTLH